MFPKTLNEWSIQGIIDLLAMGYYEDEFFDFKEQVPHSQSAEDKERLRKTCCGFANSSGGFLVFGVADAQKGLAPKVRLVGLDPNLDFPVAFGEYPRLCQPTIGWAFRNPALRLDDGRPLHVVQIPRSWNGPHCFRDRRDLLVFGKRTNQGNDQMTYTEIRAAFLGYYEKRIKLQLLRTELENVANEARQMMLPAGETDTVYSNLTFELSVIESVLSDTYTILADKPELLRLLNALRNQCKIINTRQQLFFGGVVLGYPEEPGVVGRHNAALAGPCERTVSLAREAIIILDSILSE